MIYNFNLGIGWASSGVEYAQLYRARMFRMLGRPAKFIFTDMFPKENIEHLTSNIGFKDDEVIWLYTYFTDFHISQVTYTLAQFQKTIADQDFRLTRNGDKGKIVFSTGDKYITLYFVDEKCDLLHRVEYVSNGRLVRKDYFTYGRIYSEYYAPFDGTARLYLRRFFNEDGTVAYEEMTSGENAVFRFPDQILFSKEDLVGYFVRSLELTSDDVLIVDRTTGIGQAILQNAGQARVGVVVHADHYSVSGTTDTHILWNNYYEYPFDMYHHIDFFVVSTASQKQRMDDQFRRFIGETPQTVVIPVGSLENLSRPAKPRREYSVITVSRLASEKHLDWVIEACVIAKKKVPRLSLDICGEGAERSHLETLISDRRAQSYIRLLGQKDMSEVYPNYELYLSASTSEGFGLSLMEAVGAGLAMIGLDVPYGNPTFINDGQNGHLIPVQGEMTEDERIRALANCVIAYFLHDDKQQFEAQSYRIASNYLTERVANLWNSIIQTE